MTRMDCGEVRDLLHAYTDQELPLEEHRAVAAHVEHCRLCAQSLDQLEGLRERLRKTGTFTAPAALEQRLRSAIGAESRHPAHSPRLRWAALAATHLLAVVLGGLVAYGLLWRDDTRERVVRDVVSAHVRALLSDQLVQVASADTHTVKPWLVAKIPYAPEIRDLSAQEFPLSGARIDYVLDRPTAAIVYGRRKHRINLFVVPSEHSIGPKAFEDARNGHNIFAWQQGAFMYYAVSDLNRDELRRFVELFRTGSAR